MRKRLLALVVLLLSTVLVGYTLPEQSYEFFVYDEVGILSKEDKDYIVNVNLDLRSKTKGEVVVAIVNTIEDGDISEYATKLFEKWKIGDKESSNGVLILYAIKDRKFKLETGYGVEGFIPDALAGRVMKSGLSFFPEEDYDSSKEHNEMYSKGILESFNQVITLYEGEYNVEIDANPPENIIEEESESSLFQRILTIIILIIVISRFFGGPGGRRRRRYPRFPGGFDDDFFGSGGFGGFSGGGSSGGSFGGFSGGGGRSGGGGASGGW